MQPDSKEDGYLPLEDVDAIFEILRAAEDKNDDLDAFLSFGIGCLTYSLRRGVPSILIMQAVVDAVNETTERLRQSAEATRH